MGKIIKCVLSDENIEALKKIYQATKTNLPPDVTNFDKFLEWSVKNAMQTHIQLASINQKMFNFLGNKDVVENIDYESVNEFVNNLFKDSSKKEEPIKKPATNSLKNNKKKLN